MMNRPLVLTLDFGTQSLRTCFVDDAGTIIDIVKKPYQPVYYSEEKGYAEQDADFYWQNCIDALKELCARNKDKLDKIVGATITTFRDTAVFLDKNNKPLRKCILWLDQRTAKAKEKIPALYSFIFKVVGMKNTIILNRKRTMAHWVKENEPHIWSRTRKYVNISTYLIYKLTGNLVDCPSGMTGHYPINFKAKKWYGDRALKGIIFGVPGAMLPKLQETGTIAGNVLESVAKEVGLPSGVRVYLSGSDKGCETLGLGALSRDVAAVSYGTACSIEVSNRKYHEPEPFLPAYGAVVPGWYNMEVQVYRGYWMLGWFSKNFAAKEIDEATIQNMAVEEILNAKLSDVAPGSDGLVLQPYWGPGLRRPLAKGAIVGFSDIHTKEHMYRAIIEGIAYALREGLEGIEKSQRHKVKEIRISGGGSQSDAICQITADIFGLKVSRVQTYETTSLGAATSVFLATKRFTDVEEAEKTMSHVRDTFIPSRLAHQQYQYLYKKVYLKMFPQLKDVYKDIDKFEKKY